LQGLLGEEPIFVKKIIENYEEIYILKLVKNQQELFIFTIKNSFDNELELFLENRSKLNDNFELFGELVPDSD